MADEVSIDKNQFHERLSAFIAQWKTDKRSGDQLFNGAGSVTIVMGKSEEAQGYNKASAMQVSAYNRILDTIGSCVALPCPEIQDLRLCSSERVPRSRRSVHKRQPISDIRIIYT